VHAVYIFQPVSFLVNNDMPFIYFLNFKFDVYTLLDFYIRFFFYQFITIIVQHGRRSIKVFLLNEPDLVSPLY